MKLFFRVSCSLPAHPKAIRLARKLGWSAVGHLPLLWAWVGLNRPDGDLSEMSYYDIGMAAKVPPNSNLTPESWAQALVETGWLDGETGSHRVHDWEGNNRFFSDVEKRRVAADRQRRHRYKVTPPHEKSGQGERQGASRPGLGEQEPSRTRDIGQDERDNVTPKSTLKESNGTGQGSKTLVQKSDELFDSEFWPFYPRKEDKKAARAIYHRKVQGDPKVAAQVKRGVLWYRKTEQWQPRGGRTPYQFVPLPTTFLNRERYADIPDESLRPEESERKPEVSEIPASEFGGVIPSLGERFREVINRELRLTYSQASMFFHLQRSSLLDASAMSECWARFLKSLPEGHDTTVDKYLQRFAGYLSAMKGGGDE